MPTAKNKLRVGLVGCRHGAQYIPILKCHPNVAAISLSDSDPERLAGSGQTFGVSSLHPGLDAMLDGADVDAVILMTPAGLHAEQAAAVLESGRHCACAIPMGLSTEELLRVAAASRSGAKYMMFEPNAYLDEVLYLKEQIRIGRVGRVQLLRGFQYYNLDRPRSPWWRGFPPMHYISHAIAPLLCLLDTRACEVSCRGSGRFANDAGGEYDNPYPIETALFGLEGIEAAAEVVVGLFATAVEGKEGFDLYGQRLTFLWRQLRGQPHAIVEMSAKGVIETRQENILPQRRGLPSDLEQYVSQNDDPNTGPRASLVHEFLSSILDDREPAIGAARAYDFTAPGICAHTSALRSAAHTPIPSLDEIMETRKTK